MKTINYTGSSKLISRIVNLLNRKAPLPLDGNGDPDWGTNGQVLSTDGSGNTAWVNQGGGGSGGHTIWNRIKTALTARGKLWFADASVSDVSADDATKVEVVTELASESAFDNLPTDGTADGIYAFPDSGGEYLTAAMSSYDNTASGLSATDVQDAIDSVEEQVATTSDRYNSSRDYAVGEYCIYDDVLYKCTTACTAASWAVNSSCFAADTVVNALDALSFLMKEMLRPTVRLTDDHNMNSVAPGFYYQLALRMPTNAPANAYNAYIFCAEFEGEKSLQIWYSRNQQAIYYRGATSGSWDSWKRISAS